MPRSAPSSPAASTPSASPSTASFPARKASAERLSKTSQKHRVPRVPHLGPGNESPTTHIFYETPHRIVDALADIVDLFGPDQRIVLARELTKLHEEFLRGTAAELLANLRARPSIRGEMVLLSTAPRPPPPPPTSTRTPASPTKSPALMRSESLSEKDALKRVAKSRGIGKSEAYREWQRSQPRKR